MLLLMQVADFGLARYDEGQIQGLEAATRRSVSAGCMTDSVVTD
jgi:hypothetical protein